LELPVCIRLNVMAAHDDRWKILGERRKQRDRDRGRRGSVSADENGFISGLRTSVYGNGARSLRITLGGNSSHRARPRACVRHRRQPREPRGELRRYQEVAVHILWRRVGKLNAIVDLILDYSGPQHDHQARPVESNGTFRKQPLHFVTVTWCDRAEKNVARLRLRAARGGTREKRKRRKRRDGFVHGTSVSFGCCIMPPRPEHFQAFQSRSRDS